MLTCVCSCKLLPVHNCEQHQDTAGVPDTNQCLQLTCCCCNKCYTIPADLMSTELAALVGESYERAYTDMVRVQQLTELEEVIAYKEALGRWVTQSEMQSQ